MNKLFKNVTAIALAGAMVMGMNVSAFAAPNRNTNSSLTEGGTSVDTDINTIKLVKDFDAMETGTETKGIFKYQITPYGVWNAGPATGVKGTAVYTKATMPVFTSGTQADGTGSGNVYTTDVIATNTDTDGVSVTLPPYKSVGDFWYEVQESFTTKTADTTPAYNRITGVIYGTNDKTPSTTLTASNGGRAATYYLHVQVVNNPTPGDTPEFMRSVTLHKDAPNTTAVTTNTLYNTWATANSNANYKSDVKVPSIQNQYYAGTLQITKKVSGNAGDHDKRFKVTVTFTKPQNTLINGDIVIENGYKTENAATVEASWTILGQNKTSHGWKNGSNAALSSDSVEEGHVSVDVWIQEGTLLSFKNVPYGVTYTIKEAIDANDDAYSNKMYYDTGVSDNKDAATTFNTTSLSADTESGEFSKTNADGYFTNSASGSISDALDKVIVENKKDATIDIGVITDNAPYIALLVIAAAAMVIFLRRKSRMEE